MPRASRVGVLLLLLAGCGDRGSVTFNLKTPPNPLLNPVAQPELVSEYDIRTASGMVIGIASAVQSSAQNSNGLLPLGALMPAGAPVDVYVTVLSGGNLLGMARIEDVVIKSGAKASYDAQLRKPLVLVGSSLPPETNAGNALVATEILDPIALTDLAHAPTSPPVVSGGMTAGASTWDGRFVVIAQGKAITAFDTGVGQNASGSYTLPFAPSRIVVAPRDQAIVALDPGNGTAAGSDGSLAIVNDVAGFVAAPGSASPKIVTIRGAVARTAAFSPDGTKLYVLTGGATIDPCAPGSTTTPNAVITYSLDGSMMATAPLTGFASDLAVDPASGTLVIADVSGKRIATLDAGGSAQPVLGNLTCPSAVRVVNGTVFAITSDRDASVFSAFVLKRVPLKGGAATATSFVGPSYKIPILSDPSPNGNIGTTTLPVRPGSIWAYELAITPDGNRAEFATRAVYSEHGTPFTFSGENCTAMFTIKEYGLYAVDIRTGNASYQMRSQLADNQGMSCVTCTLGTLSQTIDCGSQPGDRPSGLAATFGQ
jgi:hypothetical protein